MELKEVAARLSVPDDAPLDLLRRIVLQGFSVSGSDQIGHSLAVSSLVIAAAVGRAAAAEAVYLDLSGGADGENRFVNEGLSCRCLPGRVFALDSLFPQTSASCLCVCACCGVFAFRLPHLLLPRPVPFPTAFALHAPHMCARPAGTAIGGACVHFQQIKIQTDGNNII